MNRFGILFKPLMWFMAILLAAFVAGCGSGGGGGGGGSPSPSANAAGGVCTGSASACVHLASAGSFVILTNAAINDTGPSTITGNIGTSGSGAGIAVKCAEMTGTIFDADGAYAGGGVANVACRSTVSTLAQAVTDAQHAYGDALGRTATIFPGINTISGSTPFGPGVYNYPAGLAITSNITLQGTSTDVWIFKVTGALSQSAATTVSLAGGAMAQNIFWQVSGNSAIAAGAHFEGIILSPGVISVAAASSVDGRLFAGGGGAVNLNTNRVTRPAP
jgi:hypothetical protein